MDLKGIVYLYSQLSERGQAITGKKFWQNILNLMVYSIANART